MAKPERAIVLSHLQLGPAGLPAEVLGKLTGLLGDPKAELVLAGHTLELQGKGLKDLPADAVAALSALGRALPPGGALTFLCGNGEEALERPEERRRLEEILGRPSGQVSYGTEVLPGLSGRRLQAADGAVPVLVLAQRRLDPLYGTSLGELLSWGSLKGFVRGFARQVQLRVDLPAAPSPQHHFAQGLARAIVDLARGKEEQLLTELGNFLDARRSEPETALSETLQALLSRAIDFVGEAVAAQVRGLVGPAAAAVVVGSAARRLVQEDPPQVVLTGSARRLSYAEVQLAGPLRITLGGGQGSVTLDAIPAPAAAEQPAEPAPASARTPAAAAGRVPPPSSVTPAPPPAAESARTPAAAAGRVPPVPEVVAEVEAEVAAEAAPVAEDAAVEAAPSAPTPSEQFAVPDESDGAPSSEAPEEKSGGQAGSPAGGRPTRQQKRQRGTPGKSS